MGVVYFDQHLGAAHPKRWSKYAILMFLPFFFALFYTFSAQIRSKKSKKEAKRGCSKTLFLCFSLKNSYDISERIQCSKDSMKYKIKVERKRGQSLRIPSIPVITYPSCTTPRQPAIYLNKNGWQLTSFSLI